MTMFTPAIARVKREYEKLLPESAIAQALELCGYRGRKRILTPAQSVYLLLLQLLHQTALSGLRHVAAIEATASAICQARARLPLQLMILLVERAAATLTQAGPATAALFCGLEVLLLDASSAQSQDTPELAGQYGKPKNQHGVIGGYPSLKLLCLMNYATGMITRLIDLPRDRQEHRVLGRILGHLTPGRVLLADRGLVSFAFLAQILVGGGQACLRLPARQIAGSSAMRKVVRVLGRRRDLVDELVCWKKSPRACQSLTRRDYAALPAELLLRQIRFRLTQPGFRPDLITVITTLADPAKYPAEEIAQLYLRRWQIEVYFRDLKRSQGLLRLRARTLAGAKKELLGHVLLYNLVRGVMRDAAQRQNVAPDRLSFRDALRHLRHAADAPGEAPVPVKLLVNPRRRRKSQPRRVKYINLRYPNLQKPRASYQTQLNAVPRFRGSLT
jgi:hypothetical protein